MTGTSETWDVPGIGDIEKKSFSSILENSETQAEMILSMGWTQSMYDCYVNHYADYDWEDMQEQASDAIPYWEDLGWSKESWNGEVDYVPRTEIMEWDELSEQQQFAALQLCYFQETWSLVPLTAWEEYAEGNVCLDKNTTEQETAEEPVEDEVDEDENEDEEDVDEEVDTGDNNNNKDKENVEDNDDDDDFVNQQDEEDENKADGDKDKDEDEDEDETDGGNDKEKDDLDIDNNQDEDDLEPISNTTTTNNATLSERENVKKVQKIQTFTFGSKLGTSGKLGDRLGGF